MGLLGVRQDNYTKTGDTWRKTKKPNAFGVLHFSLLSAPYMPFIKPPHGWKVDHSCTPLTGQCWERSPRPYPPTTSHLRSARPLLTDADDHLRYRSWLHWESPLHGPLAQQVDVGARPEERRPRKQATAPAVCRRGILCVGSWRSGFRRWGRGGRPGILDVMGHWGPHVRRGHRRRAFAFNWRKMLPESITLA